MKGVAQTIPTPPHGDCFRACVASILELPIEAVPNPDPAEHWWDAWHEWLLPRGLQLVEWDVGPDVSPTFCPLRGYWIATVPSLNSRRDPEKPESWTRHCIVMHDDEIAWDPSTGVKRTVENWAPEDRIFHVSVIAPLSPAGLVPEDPPASQGEEREPEERRLFLAARKLVREMVPAGATKRLPDNVNVRELLGDLEHAVAESTHTGPRCEGCGKEVGEDRGPYPPDGIYLCEGCELPVTAADQKGQADA